MKAQKPLAHADAMARADAQLAAAHAQTQLVEGQLQRLQVELSELQQQVGELHAQHLLQTNEQLVLAALQSRTIADAALAELESARHGSEHDALTGVANRRLLMRTMHNSLANARRHGWHCAVLFVDIDDFKQINDALGHVAGDEVLKQIANCLQSAVGSEDLVSRHGGEEFIVLVPQIADASGASALAQRIHQAVATTLAPDSFGEPLPVSVSIGIALFPEAADTAIGLIDHADTAMYQAKRAGLGGTVIYQPGPLELNPLALVKRSLRQRASSDLQLLQSTLRDANQQLLLSALSAQEHEADANAAQQRQARFLAIVAHELRNPLTPILTAASLLDRAETDDTLVKRMQVVIEQQVMYMVRLIDDLLDRSRANAGKFRLDLASVDICEVVRNSVHACAPAVHKREQQLQLNLPNEAVWVRGDRVRLLQVCTNLLDNASKYTSERGEIKIDLQVSIDYLTLSVSDNGIGITAADMPHIFDLFAQDPRAVSYHGGGLGIGLAVVRELVQAHKGSVQASSAGRDLGSEFVLTLPLATINAVPVAASWD